MTFVLSLASLLFVWVVAFPIGIYSAVKQYSIGDYFATFIGFLGLATPNFLLALILMYIAFKFFNQSVGASFHLNIRKHPGLGEGWQTSLPIYGCRS